MWKQRGRGRLFGLSMVAAVVVAAVASIGAQAAPVVGPLPAKPGPRTGAGFSEVTVIEMDGPFVVSVETRCVSDFGVFNLVTPKGGPSQVQEFSLALQTCSIKYGGKERSECSIRDSTNKKAGFIETRKLRGRLVWLKEKPTTKESEEEAGVLLWPEAEGSSPTGKEPLATVEITGALCAAAGTYTLKGSTVGKVTSPAVGSIAPTMAVEFPSKPISTYFEGESSPRTKGSAALNVGEGTAKMTSVEKLSLESKEEVGVFRE
jgi:hypothetical protein